ncbi:hypothetical protein TeGR_g8218 [Tetraparma gracilis]|uniref:Uncharacterized protein n=1 Tax=Tetraparma gracilis TaxID=2962635 RepID=A0ABQ6M505_9STRA|nr:hypothetical protein TeGR_g8218 [Tetraparma gracilis]
MSSEGSSPASERRNSLVDSVVHRLSVDLGVNLLGPDGNPLPVGAPPQPTGQVLDEEQGAIAATPSTVGGQGAIAATPSTVGGIETINNPVSIMYQVYRTNVEGLVSATPALAFILGSKLLVDGLAAKGGPWGDTMGARCALCMSVIELGVMGLNYKQPGYVRKRLLLGVPTQIAFAALLSYAAFDWKPGLWTPLMMTLSFWLSMIAHYPMNPEKKTFLQHVCSTLMIALLLHLGFVGLNFAIVIPTRLLAENDKPVLTLLTTGAAFPFLAFLMRKFMVGRMEYYAKGVKIGSLMILITPTVTLYFNTNIRYAIGSAMLQIVTEIAAKIVTVYMTKKQVFGHVKVAAIGPASKDAGDHQDGQQVGASKGREDDEEQRGDAESKKKHALAMMAVRWHGEIVAEKGCILAAALIAYLYFADLVESDSQGLFLIGCVFYAAEALCDLSFVWVVDKHMEVPMLSAVAYEPLLSKDSMVSSVILALAFVAMSNCIAMAASVEL